MNEPEPQKDWLWNLLKVLLYLAAGTVVLGVLAFGTCLLLLRH